MCRIICISDTHGLHNKMFYDLPKGDILIHAGDVSNVGKRYEVTEFIEWFQSVEGFGTKIFIAGNHDFAFEKKSDPNHKDDYDWLYNLINKENLSESNCVYLEDNEFLLNHPDFSRPIKFYGTPWQPEFFNWAFNLPRGGEEMMKKWEQIPNDTDILITHGPPSGIRDFVERRGGYDSVGCDMLRDRIQDINPVLCVFGHIHGAYGVSMVKDTLFVNASICTEQYKPINEPIIINLKEEDGKLVVEYIEQ